MRARIKFICMLLLAALALSGCMLTVDEMYYLPKRSEDYNNLQNAIEKAMPGLEYSAPLSGENQQTVQTADLNGDGVLEYLLFAKGSQERPLRILIFRQLEDTYQHVQTIESNGTGFDSVEYVNMDDRKGVELVVGSQLADQLIRSVSVYTFQDDLDANLLISANYLKFLTVDLDEDSISELFVLHPGQTETDNGLAELYGFEHGTMERSNEVNMSQPADQLKRIIAGKLHDGEPAVYVASTVGETALITDVYAYLDGRLVNVSLSNESGTSVQTMRNYYVYADDIDSDGVVELPSLITMLPLPDSHTSERHDLIRWYAMTSSGSEVDKRFTYHNFVGGWYLELDSLWAPRLTVLHRGSRYEFYVWDEDLVNSDRILSIHVYMEQSRTESEPSEDSFVLLKHDNVMYLASLEEAADKYGITQESVMASFHLIHQDWKTGET